MNRSLLMIALFILAGCATTAKFEEILNSYVGKPERSLIAGWGIPDSVYESGGTKYLTYSQSHSSYVAGLPPTYHTTCVAMGGQRLLCLMLSPCLSARQRAGPAGTPPTAW